MTKIPNAKLVKQIKEIMKKGVQAARHNADRQTIVTNWNVGCLVEENFLLDEGPSEANGRAVQKLSQALHRHTSFFYTAARFYRAFPTLPKESSLVWSHYAFLTLVPDEAKRRKYEQQAIQEGLDANVLYRLIQDDMEEEKEAVFFEDSEGIPQLTVFRGKRHHYRFILRESIKLHPGWGLVDAGFNRIREVFIGKDRKYHSGNIVRSVKEEEVFKGKTATYDPHLLYTYKAFVELVLDGDTMDLCIDCGFRSWELERVRFRGINCPKISTPEGRRAKEYVESRLAMVSFIVVKTYWEGKYGRFLTDIFYMPGEKDPDKVAAEGTFLNQELLDKGYAVLWR